MLLREDQSGVLAIGQQSHAWVSGQLARAWGNEQFGALEPYEEVCLAAEQHDIGMSRWDLEPTRDPQTGLPFSFMSMPLSEHLGLWQDGPRRLLAQSRYASLLVSMHGMRLYERRELEKLEQSDRAQVLAFLDGEWRYQAELLQSLRADTVTAAAAAEDVVARNSQLIWTWDYLSLAVCLGWSPCQAHDVPTAADSVELVMRRSGNDFKLEPWPFSREVVKVRCEGRRLSAPARDDAQLRGALKTAPWESVELELRMP